MGCYDEYGENHIQIKCGECLLRHFKIGDDAELPDGIYVGYEGCVVVYKGKFVAELPLEEVRDKWGCPIEIDINERNPISAVVKQITEAHKCQD